MLDVGVGGEEISMVGVNHNISKLSNKMEPMVQFGATTFMYLNVFFSSKKTLSIFSLPSFQQQRTFYLQIH